MTVSRKTTDLPEATTPSTVLAPLEWSQLDEWLRMYGESLYLIDLEEFRNNLQGFRSAFAAIYDRVRLGYSYKTNYIPLLCLEANRLGAFAEVVSRFELDLAIRLGVPGKDIIFNGPVKTLDDLQLAAEIGATVNVDSFQEIELLERLATYSEKRLNVGIRCCFQLDENHHSRFGIDIEELDEANRRLQRIDSCSVIGIHCHFSHFRDAESYRHRAEQMVSIAKNVFQGQLKFIDIGGGFCGPMSDSLRQQFSGTIPDYAVYASEVASVFAQAFPNQNQRPELILEPGMGVVSNCMRFACRVVATKRTIGRNYAVTTGSIYNIKPTLNKLNLPVDVLRAPAGQGSVGDSGCPPIQIVGYTCMEIDTLYQDFGEELKSGDILMFENAGAYTVVLLPPFIRPAPAIVGIEKDGSMIVARRSQQLDDVLQTYPTTFDKFSTTT